MTTTTPEIEEPLVIDTSHYSDNYALSIMNSLLAKKVKLGVAYIQDPDSGVLTHSFVVLSAGELKSSSDPEILPYPLMPVFNSSNVTIN